MDNDWIDNNDEDINDSNNCELSKNEVIKLLLSQDTQIDLIAPKKFKSPIWERFRLVYFRGNLTGWTDEKTTHITCSKLISSSEVENEATERFCLSRSVIRELLLRRQPTECCELSKPAARE